MVARFSVLSLAARSLRNRRTTALLTVLSIAVSVALLIGVERIRTEAESGFANTISGTDLIVGARGGAINLLLYSVFRMGEATNNISWQTYQEIARRKEVAWTIPLSLGDSHRGFRVVGTTADYFEHYRFARTRTLEFESGKPFADVFDAVIGAEVADALGYRVGQQVVIAHGLGSTSFAQHDDKPFTISGILRRTGTPVDRTVHVELAGIEAIHVGWESGTRARGATISPDDVRALDLQPKAITAFLVGLKSRLATFQLQRDVNEYRDEALMAIIPGVALQQLWSLLGVVEAALRAISAFVVFAGLLGMLISILTTLNERRREMAILRAVGARPWHVFALLVSEAGILSAAGAVAGLVLVYLAIVVVRPVIEGRFGVSVALAAPSAYDVGILGVVVAAALVMGLVPAWRAYGNAVADGMTVRV
jgi:putative ABC transport system permease protein